MISTKIEKIFRIVSYGPSIGQSDSRKPTLHDVCSVPWGVLSTVGGVQYRGRYREYRGDILSTMGDIMSTVGDIMSTGGYLEYRGGYLEYRGDILSTVGIS